MAFDYKSEYARYKRYYQSLEPAFKKPANRAYTAIIFSFLVVSLFGWYAIRPTMQTIVTLKREIIDKTDIDIKMEEKISALIEAQAAYQNIESTLPLLNQALPETSDAVRGAAQLQALAQDMHVTIANLSLSSIPLTTDSLKTSKQTPANTLSFFPLSLTVSGSYRDVTMFIQGILNLRRMITITSMNFAPSGVSVAVASGSANQTSTYVQLDLKLNVYYLP